MRLITLCIAALAASLGYSPVLAGPIVTGANIPDGSFSHPQVAPASLYDFAVANGIDRVRIAYRADYLLANPTALAAWQASVQAALKRGLIVVTDPHDYGQSKAVLAGATRYAAMLETVNAPWKGNPSVWIETDNEPHASAVTKTATGWWTLVRATYDKLRADGWTNTIVVTGIGTNNSSKYPGSVNAATYAKLFKPTDAVVQDLHSYGDATGSGTSTGTCRKGWPSGIHGALAQAEKDRMPVMIGEGGIGAGCAATLSAALSELTARPTYFRGFFWWSLSRGIPYPGLYGLIGKDGKPSIVLTRLRASEAGRK